MGVQLEITGQKPYRIIGLKGPDFDLENPVIVNYWKSKNSYGI